MPQSGITETPSDIVGCGSFINDGFSNYQLSCLKPLITEDYDYEKIRQLFHPETPPEDIESSIKQMRIGADTE